jgi:UDP-N-acetylmuramate dehydrogenase
MLKIRKNVSLAPYTSFKVGGPAKFFCEAKDEKEISEALAFAREKNLPVFVLGGGSNILVSDKGFEGVVIKISNFKFQISNLRIVCDGGCNLGKIVSESVKSGLTGLEWAAGIPGTIGGAVWGNAGAFGGTMGDVVESVGVLEIPNLTPPPPPPLGKGGKEKGGGSKIKNFKLQDCKFSYRNSIFKENSNLIILSVTLKLKKGNKAESEKKIREILAARKIKQPTDFPSAGSFFKNPRLRQGFGRTPPKPPATERGQAAKIKKLMDEFEIDTGKKLKDDKIPAGYLVERAGLRGKKIGGAMISEKHSNFIVNTGRATADNVASLAALIKTRVRNKYGIQLKEEVQYVGF